MEPTLSDGLSDEDLARIALLADPDAAVPADAVPLDQALGDPTEGLLPGWYMATPARGSALRGWRRDVVWLIIAAFMTITAYGLCNTYADLGLH
jgi:hypothetical protein